ncbi:MAG TPA: O-antigen ligase domain-containing protein [Gammaproteobacteria bacterium]|nr:O-antigen ligase domain-containing protein [Gammaproteobacteria bacterium]
MAICAILTCSIYFLIESGSGNSFPTYLLALAMVPLLVLQGRAFRTLKVDWVLIALTALFLVYMAFSVAWSTSDERVMESLAEALLVFTFCLSIPISVARFHWFLNTLVVLVILAAIVNCGYSIYLHFALPDYQPLLEPRLYSLGRLSNPVVGSLSYGFATVLAAYMILTEERRIAKAACAVAALLFLWAIVLTGSRGVYLALASGVSVGVFLRYPGNLKIQMLGVVFTLAVLALTAYLFLGSELLFKRALSFRPEIWTEFISRTIAGNIWIGVGMATDSTFQLPELLIKHPHSVFVATLYYGGVLGLLTYLAMILKSISSLHQNKESSLRLLSAMLLAFGLAATALDGDEIVTKVNYLWLLIWIPIGIAMARSPS